MSGEIFRFFFFVFFFYCSRSSMTFTVYRSNCFTDVGCPEFVSNAHINHCFVINNYVHFVGCCAVERCEQQRLGTTVKGVHLMHHESTQPFNGIEGWLWYVFPFEYWWFGVWPHSNGFTSTAAVPIFFFQIWFVMFVLLTQMNFRTLVVLDCMMHYMIITIICVWYCSLATENKPLHTTHIYRLYLDLCKLYFLLFFFCICLRCSFGRNFG